MEFGIRMGYGKRTDYLDLARPARFYQRAGELDGGDRVRLLCRSGVKFLLSYRDLSGLNGLRVVASLGARSDPPIRLYELPCAMPHAYAVGGVRLGEHDDAAGVDVQAVDHAGADRGRVAVAPRECHAAEQHRGHQRTPAVAP